MKKIILATKRPWDWKVFLILVGLVIPASFAILPFSIHLLNTHGGSGAEIPGASVIALNALLNGIIISILGGLGLLLGNRIGLGLPFIEGWVKRQPVPFRFRSAVAIGWITAVGFALAILVLQSLVFDPPMKALFEQIGYAVPEDAVTPPHYGFLAAVSAGITEETLFRLFGLTLLAWLGGFLFHDPEGRPKPAVLWTANLIFALGFGAAHLTTAATLGWPLNTLIITRTLVLNGIGGLALGWLFWTFGLETAILAHFLGDVILYTLLPIIAMQAEGTARTIAVIGVVVVVILALAWAWWTLVVEARRNHSPKAVDLRKDSQP